MPDCDSFQNALQIARKNHSVVALFSDHAEVEEAIRRLSQSGYDMKRISIIGRDSHGMEHVIGYYNTVDRMGYWGKLGAFWGGFWGLLLGSAFLLVPGIGPIVAGGPIVGVIIETLESSAVIGGLGAIGAALYSIGIPEDSVLKYEESIKSDRFLVIAHGSAGEIGQARDILQCSNAIETNVHRAIHNKLASSHARLQLAYATS